MLTDNWNKNVAERPLEKPAISSSRLICARFASIAPFAPRR
ncbi:MAG: hypothetical protein H6Q05_3067 [Acidobacteria bacterium]|nr:hypothetical protein [Acidobacteriota bacterium]